MKSACFLLCCLILVCSAQASNILLYEKANQAYHNQDFKTASSLYNQMIDEGYNSANIYYNAGNAYFKLNQKGMAVWCYEKALQLNPKFVNAKDNLMVSRTQLRVKADEESGGFSFIDRLVHLHTQNNWSIGTLLFLCLYCLFFMLKRLNKGKAFFIALRKISFVLFVCYTVLGLTHYFYKGVAPKAIMLHITNLLSNPDANSTNKLQLKEGEKITLVGPYKNGYIKVRSGKKEGYVLVTAYKKL